jgi:hypothetical protein
MNVADWFTKGHAEILDLLLNEEGGKDLLCAKDKYGQTALHQAAGMHVCMYVFRYLVMWVCWYVGHGHGHGHGIFIFGCAGI